MAADFMLAGNYERRLEGKSKIELTSYTSRGLSIVVHNKRLATTSMKSY